MEDDGDDKDDTKRRTRNLSEKKRRDQFNMLVNELSSMISSNNRKMDKSTVLKSTISFLKNHNEITHRSRAHDVQEDCKPAFLSNEEFTYLVLEALEGFVMVFSASGQIHYVSESVFPLLGHNPADVLNKSILEFAFEDDRPSLYYLLQNPESAKTPIQSTESDNEIRFQCHLRRGTLNSTDEPSYELIQFNGHFRTNLEQIDKDSRPYQQDHESRLLFVCTCRLYTPQLIRDVSLVDVTQNEFTSRHSLEWKFLFLDHRAPPIIGYLPFEVLGTSGYDYYHFDDLEKVITCHEALMQKGELTSCYYRFLTKGQQWIWLQTRFFITYHQWNSKPEFVVCTHRVVSYTDIANSMKQEAVETNTASDVEVNPSVINNSRSDDIMAFVSPSYMSEASDPLGNSCHNVSRAASLKSASVASTTATMATASASWSQPSHVLYAAGSQNSSMSGSSRSSQRNNGREMETCDSAIVSQMSDEVQSLCDTVNMEGQRSTVVRTAGVQATPIITLPESDESGDDTAAPNAGPALMPQHGMGAQYLDPAPYVGALGIPGVLQLPLPTLPVIVSPDHGQVQVGSCKVTSQRPLTPRRRKPSKNLDVAETIEEQLQKKHEELQQMIFRQQEELRQVKEQLLLARLGILQPIINVQGPYLNPEEVALNQRVPPQIVYTDGTQRSAMVTYSPQNSPHNPGHHPHMQQ